MITWLARLAMGFFCLKVFSDNKAELDLWGNAGFVTAWPWQDAFKYLNTFSFTDGARPWINHEWLGQYIMRQAYAWGGPTGLLAYKVLAGFCLAAILYLAIRRARVSGAVAFLWMLLAISTIQYGFSTRPHLLTYLLLAKMLFILRERPSLPRWFFWLLPAMGLVWANLHGAFFMGAIVLIAYTAAEGFARKRFPAEEAAVTALFVAATFVTPYGARLWEYIAYSASIPRPYLSEWAPSIRIECLIEHIDFFFLAIASVAAVARARVPRDVFGTAVLGLSLLAALAMRRNIPIFAIAATFFVPQLLESSIGEEVASAVRKLSRPLVALLLAALAAVSLAYALAVGKADPFRIEVPQKDIPVASVAFMKENAISGNALVFFDWGEYCIWKLYPECKVFIDGRLCCAYGKKTIDDYFNFIFMGKNWMRALTDYPTDIVLVHRGNPVYAQMRSMPGWEYVYEDRISGLFLKRAAHAEFFAKVDRGLIKSPATRKVEYFP